jgi:Co/Zn/Cd efflux system component
VIGSPFRALPHLRRLRPLRRNNNLRAAIIHVLGDAGVSLLVIVGLLLGFFGWVWMDPYCGLVLRAHP